MRKIKIKPVHHKIQLSIGNLSGYCEDDKKARDIAHRSITKCDQEKMTNNQKNGMQKFRNAH